MKQDSIWNKQIDWKRLIQPNPKRPRPKAAKPNVQPGSNRPGKLDALWNAMRRSTSYLGMELTDGQVKLCELESGSGGVRVMQAVGIELPAGTMSDGRIVNMAALEQSVLELLRSCQWSSRQVHLAIPSQMVMMKTVKLPDLPDKQIEKLLRYELTHGGSLPFDRPYYDYYRIGPVDPDNVGLEGERDNGLGLAESHASERLCEVAVIAAPMALLEQYTGLLHNAGLEPVSYEVKSFSLSRLNARTSASEAETGTCILMDVNASNCELTIVDEGIIRITRNVEIQFEQGNSLLAAAPFPLPDMLDEEHRFNNACQDIIAELDRLLNFYRYTLNRRHREFNRIMLTGSLARMDRLKETLSNQMSRQVESAQWGALKLAPNSADIDVSAFAVPIGLALRGREA